MTEDATAPILTSVENGILKIVFNRPRQKNALSIQMYQEISRVLDKSKDDSEVHLVVFTGNGSFFSSGNDISLNPGSNVSDGVTAYKNFIHSLIVYPKLVIAVLNGPAIGIAATMLTLCDIVYAVDRAYFQTPFTKLGLIAEGCSTYTFPRIMGHSKAGDMLYLGYKMNAHEAKQCGFISEVYEQNSLDKVWDQLKKISALSLESIIATKRLTRRWNKETLIRANEEEANALLDRLASPDFIERILTAMSKKSKL